jgi:hypothetical protein
LEPCTWDVEDWEDTEKRPRLPFQGDRVQTIIYKLMERDLFALHYRKEVTQQADNIRAILYANVVEIETDTTGRMVTRLRIACLQGQSFWVKAKAVVLAMGGIEIPRLLLLSHQIQGAGIGNQHDLVGRFFMEHPHFTFGFCLPSGNALCHSAALYDCIHPVNGVPILGKLALTELARRLSGDASRRARRAAARRRRTDRPRRARDGSLVPRDRGGAPDPAAAVLASAGTGARRP